MNPLLQWPGGKRRLLPILDEFLPPDEAVIEPFAGGAALAFDREIPTILADANPALRATYHAVGHAPDLVAYVLDGLPEEVTAKDPRYYEIRDDFNLYLADVTAGSDTYDAVVAALFLWLNKAGYNGLVRFNSKGGYNVPCGTPGRVAVPTREDIMRASVWLLYTAVYADWREVLDDAEEQAIYLDPPYQPLWYPGDPEVKASFTAYAAGGWTLDDLSDLAASAVEAARRRGCTVLASDHRSEATDAMWSGVGAKIVWTGPVRRSVGAGTGGAKTSMEGLWLLEP